LRGVFIWQRLELARGREQMKMPGLAKGEAKALGKSNAKEIM
jgi:hypothetical protein